MMLFWTSMVFAQEPQKTYSNFGFEAKRIVSGSFEMGCEQTECRENEQPVHEVRIANDFYMMTAEVTQSVYYGLMKTNPSNFKECGGDCPVENVTWFDSVAFANKLSIA